MARIEFLNTYIDNITMSEAVKKIDMLIKANGPTYIVTPNLDHIVTIERDEKFAEIYRKADLIVTDGKPLIWIAKLKGTPIKEKISGSDLFPNVCKLATERKYKIFILGAAEGVAEKAAFNLEQKYPGLKIAGTYSPPVGFEKDTNELRKIKTKIIEASPEILAVSLGSPKGEKFIFDHLNEYNVPISMSIGATIDFEAGNIKRAPKWMSEFGLEWLYRITQDPRRLIGRYFYDAFKIIPIILKYKI